MSIYKVIGLKHCTDSVYNLTINTQSPKTPSSHNSNLKQQNNSSKLQTQNQLTNFETIIHKNNFMKKYLVKEKSEEKDWKPSIKIFAQQQQSVSPSVSQRKQFYQPKRNPILMSPSPNKPKKQCKKTFLEKVLKKDVKEGIRVFKQANSSQGFINQLDFSTPHNKPITIISPRYGEGVQMKHIFSEIK